MTIRPVEPFKSSDKDFPFEGILGLEASDNMVLDFTEEVNKKNENLEFIPKLLQQGTLNQAVFGICLKDKNGKASIKFGDYDEGAGKNGWDTAWIGNPFKMTVANHIIIEGDK